MVSFRKFLSCDELDESYIYKGNYLDIADKFNWQLTVNLLLIFTFLVSNLKNFVNKIISCAVPIYFSDNQEEYANQVCYISNKYYVDENERVVISPNLTLELLNENSNTIKNQSPILISYYIWVPYILVVQALLFIIIKYLWFFALKSISHLDMFEIVKSAQISKNSKNFVLDFKQPDNEDSIHTKYLLQELNKLIYRETTNKLKSKITEQLICITYLIVKFLNLINIIFQMILIKIFLKIDFYNLTLRPILSYLNDLYPIFNWSNKHDDLMKQNLNSQSSIDESKTIYLPNSIYFPLKSMCIFQIRELAKSNSYAVMCSLPINLFIQYMFVFFSIWYTILLILNIHYMLKWCFRFKQTNKIAYVKNNLLKGFKVNFKCSKYASTCLYLKHLRKRKKFNKHEKCECDELLNSFVNDYLTSDFVFLIRIISYEANSDLLIQNIFFYNWKKFLNNLKKSNRCRK